MKTMLKRGAGVLMPIFSLPSPYGIGTFGRAAYEFIDQLKRGRQTYWQVLPMGPTCYGDSPYQSYSAFAGNPYFIDLDTLKDEKLLTQDEIDACWWCDKQDQVKYDALYYYRFPLLRTFFHTSSTDCDIANDFPRYRVYRDGVMVDDPTSVEDLWRDDLVAVLIGCSFSFESELIEAGIEMRHNTQGRNVSMYITNIACEPAGKMSGNMVVSMRPIPYEQVVQAVQISGAIPKVHGAPIHIGDPSVIGIDDISKPDFGDAVDIHEGEVPVFWPCGVTPQSVVMNVKPKFAITHAPGCMLITDTKNISLKF